MVKWLELSVEAPSEFVEPLSEIFYRYGHGGVAIEETGGYSPDEGEPPPGPSTVTILTYLPLNDTARDIRNRIELGVRLVAHLSEGLRLHEREVREEDWETAWRKHFHVLRIGQRMAVVPMWLRHQEVPSDVTIFLDPGMAFGTGHHPTTRMCLELLEELVEPGTRVLDVGCGSGILSIAAAKLGAAYVHGLETDTVASSVAVSNVAENGVVGTVRVDRGTLPHPGIQPGSYDICVANISRKVIGDLAEELAGAVRPGGVLVASGILAGDRVSIAERLRQAGAEVERHMIDGDWVAMVARSLRQG